MVRAAVVVLVSALGCADPPPPPVIPPIEDGELSMSMIHSDRVGADYELYVYLPGGYRDTAERFPVIYALDGAWNTEPMARMLEVEGIRAIIIGIGRPDRRDIDYLLPGAQPYFAFVTEELVPFVETTYRVQPRSSVLSGHSRGGLFVGLAAFLDRPAGTHFTSFISQDGAFQEHPSQTNDLEQQAFDASGGRLPITLVMSGAECCNYDEVSSLYERLKGRRYPDLVAYRSRYPDSHDNMFYPSFVDAVRIVFAP